MNLGQLLIGMVVTFLGLGLLGLMAYTEGSSLRYINGDSFSPSRLFGWVVGVFVVFLGGGLQLYAVLTAV